MSLTPKQEKFAQLYVELGNASEAYRRAYDVREGTKDSSINEQSSKLLNDLKISSRVDELKKELAERNRITKDDIIAGHKKIIAAWEELWELGAKKSLTKDEKQRFYLLKEMVKGSDYNKAYSEISKLTGAYEPDRVEIKDTTYKTKWG